MNSSDQPKKKKSVFRVLLTILFYSISGIIFSILMIKQLSPVSKLNHYLESIENDSLYQLNHKEIANHPELISITKENAYLKALTELSLSDSSQLALNLSDSSISLYIKGVEVHRARLQEPEVDAILQHLPNSHYLWLFSSPLAVTEQYATFEKEPIIVRDAPKDTIEAAAQDEIIIRENEPAFVHLKLAHDLDLIMEQDSVIDNRTRWAQYRFNSRIIMDDYRKTIQEFFSSGKMNTNATIRFKIPTNDLVSLYRALPNQAEIVIRY
jgi:hypothetical protein